MEDDKKIVKIFTHPEKLIMQKALDILYYQNERLIDENQLLKAKLSDLEKLLKIKYISNIIVAK